MGNYSKELKRLLREAGCTFVRQGKGDHEIWYENIASFTGYVLGDHTSSPFTYTIKIAALFEKIKGLYEPPSFRLSPKWDVFGKFSSLIRI